MHRQLDGFSDVNSMNDQCKHGGWILGNTVDGTQAEYVRVPFASNNLYVPSMNPTCPFIKYKLILKLIVLGITSLKAQTKEACLSSRTSSRPASKLA